jgi:hypothetical protein
LPKLQGYLSAAFPYSEIQPTDFSLLNQAIVESVAMDTEERTQRSEGLPPNPEGNDRPSLGDVDF